MRVLFWQEMFGPYVGGVETFANEFLPAMRRQGHEFIIVTRLLKPHHEPETDFDGIPVHRIPFWSAFAKRDLETLVAVRRKITSLKTGFKPDLVHVATVGPSTLVHLDTRAAWPAPTLVSLHKMEFSQSTATDSLLEKAIGAADWVNCVSEAALARTREIFPQMCRNSSFIYNAVEAPREEPKPLSFDPPTLLCIGRLVKQKGFDIALRAFVTVIKDHPSARLVLAGNGPERDALVRQISDLGLDENVDYIGLVKPDKVFAAMNSATVVVMPSRLEPFGIVAIQAAFMGRPVIAARVGGLPEVVVDGQTGLIVEPEDAQRLSEALVFILDHRDEAASMGGNALHRAREVFNMRHCVQQYDDLYESLRKNGTS